MAKHGALEHPKTKRLARALGTIPGVALGLLETIWHWVSDYRKDGALSAIDIEDALDSGGWLTMFKASDVIAAMTDADRECIWLDTIEGGRYFIHDWHEHADDAVNRSLARAISTFANGVRPNFSRLEQKERERILSLYKAQENAHSAPNIEPKEDDKSTPGARLAPKVRTLGREPEPKPEPKPNNNPPYPPPNDKPRKRGPAVDHSEGIDPPPELALIPGFGDAWRARCAQRFSKSKTHFPTPDSVHAELAILCQCRDPIDVLRRATAGGWQGLNTDSRRDYGPRLIVHENDHPEGGRIRAL